MIFLIGAGLAVATAIFAAATGFDRSRAFYPVILIVIATYYPLFAAMAGEPDALLKETPLVAMFVLAAVAGFRGSLWIAVVALAAHGGLDALHPHIVRNPGVPAWWPSFCLAYDLAAAGGLALLLRRRPPPSFAQET
jgi:hypothetical protein